MPPIGSRDLWQAALARWAEIASKSRDLEPALGLQQGMLRAVIDASGQLEAVDGECPRIPSDVVLGKWIRGLPAFRNEIIPIPGSVKDVLLALSNTLVEGGAGDSALHIRNALTEGTIDAGSLLTASLERNEKAIRTSAVHMGLSPDLVWLIGELASSPLAHHLQAAVLGRPEMTSAVRDWDRGYCPCCGSWPVLIEVLNGSRMLRCSFCSAAWELKSHRCIYCGNSGGNFVTAAPDVAHKHRRADLCGACGSYTKVLDVTSLTPFPLLAIEDLASIDLDQGAMSREYSRPKLYDLDAIEPLSSDCA